MAPKTRQWRRQRADHQVADRRSTTSILERLSGNLLKTINQQQHHNHNHQLNGKSLMIGGNSRLDYHYERSRNLLQSFKQDHHHLWYIAANSLSLIADRLARLSTSQFALLNWQQQQQQHHHHLGSLTSGTPLKRLSSQRGDISRQLSPYGDSGDQHNHHRQLDQQQQQQRVHHHLVQQLRQSHQQVANWLNLSGKSSELSDGDGSSAACSPYQDDDDDDTKAVSSNPSRPVESVRLARPISLMLPLLSVLLLSFVFTSASSSASSSSSSSTLTLESRAAVPSISATAAARPAVVATAAIRPLTPVLSGVEPVGAVSGHADQANREVSSLQAASVGNPAHPLPASSGALLRRSSSNTEHSPLDFISSANLPAEFRGGDLDDEPEAEEAPREQSKLARLCQQTSSVLASVLPAPFGGHKRSILCQFFGQVPLRTNNQAAQQQQQKQLPVALAPLPVQRPLEQESIAVLHQAQHPPITMHSSGRHPIQIVLEEQQRQYLAGLSLAQQHQFKLAPPNPPPIEDLNGSASIVDYRYQQKVQAPESVKEAHKTTSSSKLKYSTPAASTSFKPVSVSNRQQQQQQVSSGGWRIFNQPPDTTQMPLVTTNSPSSTTKYTSKLPTSTTVAPTSRSTSTMSNSGTSTTSKVPSAGSRLLPVVGHRNESGTISAKADAHQSTTASAATMSTANSRKSNAESAATAQLLVMGKPPVFNQQVQPAGPKQLTIGKRSEALKTTTKSATMSYIDAEGSKDPSSDVRIIEVVAQSSGNSTSPANVDQQADKRQVQVMAQSNTTTSTQRPADLHQVQKREELVIASINNLTRIAFGNQLRDTVKVINKLIDQQSSLFNKVPDPLVVSESRKSVAKSSASLEPPLSKSDKLVRSDVSGGKPRQKAISTSSSNAELKPSKKVKKQQQPTAAPASFSSSPSLKKASFSSQKITATVGSTTSSTTSGFARSSRRAKPAPVERSELRANRAINNADSSSSSAGSRQQSSSTTTTTTARSTRPMNNNNNDDDDLFPMVAVRDIHRDKSPWQLSSASANGGFVPSSPKALISMSPSTIKRAVSQKVVGSPTPSLPWILERGSSAHYAADSPVELRKVSAAAASAGFGSTVSSAALKKWTATRKVPVQSSTTAAAGNRYTAGKIAKLDSLTTLKMSLQSTLASNQPPTRPSSVGTTQSRWVPTASATRPSSSASTGGTSSLTGSSTTPLPPLLSTSTTISSPTREGAPESEVTQMTASPSPSSPTTTEVPLIKASTGADEVNDLNEARASDSISRFTTHWSEANGNELLATTRRLFQQPLPQIAQTGEFFSAETISSWPERYQTMMGQAAEGSPGRSSSPAANFESTRRNGEAYETTTNEQVAPRHRWFESTPPVERTRTTLADLSLINLPGITVLPANHKLTTTSAQSADSSANQQAQQGDQSNSASARSPQEATIPPELRRTVPAPMVAYTLMGPFSGNTVQPAEQSEQPTSESGVSISVAQPKFPQVLDDYALLAIDQQRKGSAELGNATSSPLRPPYSELQDDTLTDDKKISANLQSVLFNNHTNKSNSSRKLYDLLSSTGSFMNPQQSSISSQRFNLSALKFLAQSILQQAGGSYGSNYTLRDEVEGYQGLARQNKLASQQLLDLLGSSSFPSNYYELLFNETSASSAPETVSDDSSATQNRTSGKSLLGRAGNLLNDLRQLEQRKAAALLAAIRYQVPSPLVRPWDVASDLEAFGGIVRTPANDRLDDDTLSLTSDGERLKRADLLKESLILAQASQAIKSALMKQRVVPRDELEARLKGGKMFGSSEESGSIMSDRRSDSTKVSDVSSYLDDSVEYATAINGSRHDNADYVILSDDSSKPNQNRANDTKSWLEKLFSLPANKYNTLLNKTAKGDFDLIALSNISASPETKLGVEAGRFPMYIRMNDYQTASSAKPTNLKAKEKSERQSLPSSAIAARLRSTLNSARETTQEDDRAMAVGVDDSGAKDQQHKKTSEFDCHEKTAGFYPDIDTTCQTFYHCSSTGHLLTFNCPQQTRFDEKSLKCGPWFEVACDLGRMKLKRPVRAT